MHVWFQSTLPPTTRAAPAAAVTGGKSTCAATSDMNAAKNRSSSVRCVLTGANRKPTLRFILASNTEIEYNYELNTLTYYSFLAIITIYCILHFKAVFMCLTVLYFVCI